MLKELKEIQHQLTGETQIYKEILTETLKYQLIDTIKANENRILDTLRQIMYKGGNRLTIYFVPEHIYKSTFVYNGELAEFSLEHCINDYLFEERFFGRKQVRFTDIHYKKFYENFTSKVDLFKLKLIHEILKDNPSITTNLKSYFESLGLSNDIRPHKYLLVVDLSF